MTTNDTDIDVALRSALAEELGPSRFDLWFGRGTRLDWDGATLHVGAPHRFFLDFIRTNFRRHLENACQAALETRPSIEFHIEGACGAAAGTGLKAPASSRKAHLAAGNGHSAAVAAVPAILRLATPEAAASRPAAEPEQHAMRRKFASLETFVASTANKLTRATAEAAATQPGRFTPLLVYGPTGVGKTHLLEGIWTTARKLHRTLSTVYLTAEQFTSHFVEAVRGSGMPSFRRKYRGVGVLIFDDLQFLAGKQGTLRELLHTVDALLQEGRQVVFAADRPAAELTELGPELITRLQSGMVCRLDPPDHAARVEIVGQMVRQLKLHVPADVQQYVATRLTSHARELSGALRRLQATSEVLGEPISLRMAEEALAELVRHSGRVVRLPDIEKAICNVFGLEPTTLQSGGKGKRVSHPRMLAMWLARKHTRAALSEIGNYFGRRSHSTVVSAQKRVDDWMTAGKMVELAERAWSIDEAVRQVERQLLAG